MVMIVTHLTTTKQLHDDVEVFVILKNIVQLDDVGMVNLLHDIYLVLERHLVFLGHLTPNKL